MINKFYFKRSLVSLLTLAALMGSSEGVFAIGSPRNSSQLEDMPDLPFVHICHHLSSKDLGSLRQASKEIKMKVENYDDFYINPLISQLTTFTPVISEDLFHEAVIRSVTDCGFRTRLIAALKKEIEENGFLLDRRGSGLSLLLGKSYTRVIFSDFISEGERAPVLFKELFDCDLPEENRDQFIAQLAACFPIDAVYFSEDAAKNLTLADYYKNHRESMLNKALKTQSPYFSYGASDPEKLDDAIPHNIVVSQSDLNDSTLNHLLKENNPHTVIVAIQHAEGGILNLPGFFLLENVRQLRLVDQQQVCTSIGNNFLALNRNIEFLDISGLNNLTSIGDGFLSQCTSLTSLDTRGLINVKSIGKGCLFQCTSLTSFDTRDFINVTSIGDNFLSMCTSLTSLDTSGLFNVTSIRNFFLSQCTSLTSLDPRGFINVTSIGNFVLHGCKNLTSLDTRGLINVKSIGTFSFIGCSSLKASSEEILERNTKDSTKE